MRAYGAMNSTGDAFVSPMNSNEKEKENTVQLIFFWGGVLL